MLEHGDTLCAASQVEKRLPLIRRTITHPLVAERSSCSQPLPSRPHTFTLYPGGEDSQLVCVYTSSTPYIFLLHGVSYTWAQRGPNFSSRTLQRTLLGGQHWTCWGRVSCIILAIASGIRPIIWIKPGTIATKSTRLDKLAAPTTEDPGDRQIVFEALESCARREFRGEVIISEVGHIFRRRRP